jgi:hypothetical protein
MLDGRQLPLVHEESEIVGCVVAGLLAMHMIAHQAAAHGHAPSLRLAPTRRRPEGGTALRVVLPLEERVPCPPVRGVGGVLPQIL